jgi:predicted small secreted protein
MKGIMSTKVLLAACLLVLSLFLAGCQTVQGIGADVKWLGETGAAILER